MPAVSGSFRDPSGHVFTRAGRLLRQINHEYAPDYEHLQASGLYDTLVERRLLVPHREVAEPPDAGDVYRIVEPERIPFVSYPFEWSFSQLKAGALATLAVQRAAVERGMVLKDASAYNVQFRGAAPLFIDTLSFERWAEGTPWIAYRQFCQHFLGPLALMSATDARLGALSRVFIDGAPLDLVSALLPFSSRLHPSLLIHLHLHARAQARHGGGALSAAPARFSRAAMLGLIDSLRGSVERLACARTPSVWRDYYANTNYSETAMADKRAIMAAWLGRERPAVVWDLGANTGAFSEIAAGAGAYAVAFDGDQAAVEQHFLDCRGRDETQVLPLVMDLANPSGPIGWDHGERLSLAQRGPADVVMALGLLHHLTLANQVPFALSAQFLQRLARTAIVEFVPRDDSQVQGMLSRMPRADAGYSRDAFERAFEPLFQVADVSPIAESGRRLYLLRNRAARAAAA